MTDSLKCGEDFSLLCDTKEQLPYALKCLAYLDNLPQEVEKRLRKYIFRYYKDFEKYLFEDEIAEMGIIDENTVFEHICIYSVIVEKECRQERIEFYVEGGCDWEPEHGLEITFSNGKILYTGSFEDNPPYVSCWESSDRYYGPDANLIMNYADKE